MFIYLWFILRLTELLCLTAHLQSAGFLAPHQHLWLIKHWFSASTFVVKIATFAKPETVTGNLGIPIKTKIKQGKE
jgi:hypothetical protein